MIIVVVVAIALHTLRCGVVRLFVALSFSPSSSSFVFFQFDFEK